jgi:hypothetical protein
MYIGKHVEYNKLIFFYGYSAIFHTTSIVESASNTMILFLNFPKLGLKGIMS